MSFQIFSTVLHCNIDNIPDNIFGDLIDDSRQKIFYEKLVKASRQSDIDKLVVKKLQYEYIFYPNLDIKHSNMSNLGIIKSIFNDLELTKRIYCRKKDISISNYNVFNTRGSVLPNNHTFDWKNIFVRTDFVANNKSICNDKYQDGLLIKRRELDDFYIPTKIFLCINHDNPDMIKMIQYWRLFCNSSPKYSLQVVDIHESSSIDKDVLIYVIENGGGIVVNNMFPPNSRIPKVLLRNKLAIFFSPLSTNILPDLLLLGGTSTEMRHNISYYLNLIQSTQHLLQGQITHQYDDKNHVHLYNPYYTYQYDVNIYPFHMMNKVAQFYTPY
jgi:hypothetical protein